MYVQLLWRSCYHDNYIKVPTGDALKEVIYGFEHKWGFPQCGGAVDGTHIPIMSPRDFPADYFNHKGWHSIIMQEWLTIYTDLLISALDSPAESMMLEF